MGDQHLSVQAPQTPRRLLRRTTSTESTAPEARQRRLHQHVSTFEGSPSAAASQSSHVCVSRGLPQTRPLFTSQLRRHVGRCGARGAERALTTKSGGSWRSCVFKRRASCLATHEKTLQNVFQIAEVCWPQVVVTALGHFVASFARTPSARLSSSHANTWCAAVSVARTKVLVVACAFALYAVLRLNGGCQCTCDVSV